MVQLLSEKSGVPYKADVMAVCYCGADVMIVIMLQALVRHDKVNRV